MTCCVNYISVIEDVVEKIPNFLLYGRNVLLKKDRWVHCKRTYARWV